MMMMYGFDGPLGWLPMVLGMVIHIAFAVMVVLAAIWLFRSLFRGAEQYSGERKAEIILKQRYAKGEISLEDYQRMKKELASI
ncbi:MAG: SHOCT domain-containing protein [Sporomusaceae bacterium]|nr:SHOCT domain-containing protein [Sporomusaceae bacterium]